MNEYESDVDYKKMGNLTVIHVRTYHNYQTADAQFKLHQQEIWEIVRSNIRLGVTYQINVGPSTIEKLMIPDQSYTDVCDTEIYLNRIGE